MNLEKRANVLKKIYFMLKMDQRGAYITPVDSNGKILENIEIDEGIDKTSAAILTYIKEIKEDSFFIDWENEYEEPYLSEHPDLIEYLIDNPIFVNEKMERLKWIKRDNTLSLIIKEKENTSTVLTTELLLNGAINDFVIINEDLILADDIFYIIDMESNDFHTLKELVGTIDESGLENFLTLTIKYFKNIEIEYKNYKVVEGEKNTPNPQLIIEKISHDNSLYLQVTLMVSGMHYDFLNKHEIDKVAIVNNMEKKISICKIDISKISEAIEDIIKLLVKNQKNLKVRASYYLDESNFIIMQEKLAKEFIMQDLLQLASKYKVVGTDKLRKYNIKAVKPKVIGKFTHSIDFLEGEVELEIEGEKFSILDVLSSYRKDSYIMLSDGTSALINKKYIEKLERIFKDSDKKKVKLSFFDLPLVEELIEDKIFSEEMNKTRDFFKGMNNIKDYPIELPKIKAQLREYQEYGYKWLSYLMDNNLGGCLADDMGLGKTLQAISVLTRLHEEKGKKSLVIMPKSLIYNWESEIKRFSPRLKVGIYYGNFRNRDIIKKNSVVLTTYGTIRNDIEIIRDYIFDAVILDESQNIKNVNAQTTKAIMLLNAKHRIALSGTPIENNLSELYSLFRFLNPSMFGTMEEFNNYYAIPIQKENDQEAIDELKKKVYPFILRRIKKEVLKDLPDKIEKTMYIEMNHEQKKLYEERRNYYYNMVHSQIKENGFGKTQFFILQALNELRQITSCPEVKSIGVTSSKREVLINNILDAVENGHKVLVFTNYISSIKNICEDLEKYGIKYLSMSGSTKDRQLLVNKFQKDNKYKVFVMTLKTGGVGLNLTAADTIFIYDPWWNKTVENQAVDRAYRLGQDRTVFSYKLILKDTIEEKILQLQESKIKLLDNLISEDSTTLKTLTEKDIEFILGE
ncbi:ATP-dependent helicase HepA [Fusobacterium necrogenes]|uniref:ATP-dependent helicase HepA n=1 Tax=Fusobacterium necrogenes TaxID=858 RepID=A0A377GUZ2_9FUSO|nr:DEAD/DEAH box helicase [Fusobacterium necrogenes]STO30787.1 ATP-dependent helicase HepA [Fusobacterium necrogenes]